MDVFDLVKRRNELFSYKDVKFDGTKAIKPSDKDI
jgi:hypothetical protein